MKASAPHFGTLSRTDFPALWSVPDPPALLRYEGSPNGLRLLEKLPERGLAIVGTRDPLVQTQRDLNRWVELLGGSNLVILSGFARGIDQTAHAAAVQAGLPTIAVLGAGLSRPYPEGSAGLRKRIVDGGGLIISEFPDRALPYASHFLRRNRLIAGWSKAVWVVEAGAMSGTLNTARWARDMHIDCYATPTYPDNPRFSGNQKLLEKEPTLAFWNVKSLGHTWKELNSLARQGKSSTPPDPHARSFCTALRQRARSQGAVSIEQMVTWAAEQGWAPGQIFETLQLCLRTGWIRDEGRTLSVV